MEINVNVAKHWSNTICMFLEDVCMILYINTTFLTQIHVSIRLEVPTSLFNNFRHKVHTINRENTCRRTRAHVSCTKVLTTHENLFNEQKLNAPAMISFKVTQKLFYIFSVLIYDSMLLQTYFYAYTCFCFYDWYFLDYWITKLLEIILLHVLVVKSCRE